MSIYLILFLAGMLTILLPCILPLLPIVLGVSIAGRSPLRPLYTVGGMLISFVGFTFLLLTVLQQFVELADLIRIATYYILLLFGFGFAFHRRDVQIGGALLGALFFWEKGIVTVVIAAIAGIAAVLLGGKVATWLQQLGTNAQAKVGQEFGRESPITAFVIGLTLGLVWVPCAGPALSFAFTLVREEPGLKALLALLAYGLGTALPLLAVGYGGQAAVKTVRSASKYSGMVKTVSGVLLILTAVALQFRLFEKFQVLLLDYTNFGDIGTRIEEKLFDDDAGNDDMSSPSAMELPKLSRAPELAGLGEWFNSEPFTMASLKGKVVLVDFWTYSCINCIRTLPYIQGYWEKYKETDKFVLIGVHTPEFVFEKSPDNVRDAIERHGLTYPVVQDNDFKTWRAFANRYWPAKYLIDAEGYIRYTHFGEGAYEETDEAIAALLAEIGVTASGSVIEGETPTGQRRQQSPETYLGERSWPALQNAQGEPTSDVVEYVPSAKTELHKYELVGEWQLAGNGERQVLLSAEGEIRMRFLGGEANLVLGVEEGAEPATADVYIDGVKTQSLTINRQDLYVLYNDTYGEHDLRLVIHGEGIAGYAFTFGQGK